MFVDASVIIAVLTFEDEKELFETKLKNAVTIVTSPIAIYEAALGVTRKMSCGVRDAQSAVSSFVNETEAEILSIDEAIGEVALAAFDKFGRGKHKAALNMGDCFAYACAKSRKMPLLFKGNDFIHTDIRIA
ncbi:MAG: type II toxin-antitoxin system VapC family toxin [Hyphomicrobiales bacterium]|nr:type II toxin-antitoxin system VapC family toxin [Hyphomicrobiales bacterium]